MAMLLLFVYGTLQRGQRNHPLLSGQKLIGEARTLPRYHLHDAGAYPCLVHAPACGVSVQGELWQIEEALLPRLDALEESPRLFAREAVLLDGVARPVSAYFYQEEANSYPLCGARWGPAG